MGVKHKMDYDKKSKLLEDKFLTCLSISLLIVGVIFARDSVLSQYGGILVVTFTVVCCLPFMYYLIKFEEDKDVQISQNGRLLKEHSKALRALMWLFLGFVLGFSLGYILMPQMTILFPSSINEVNFNAQISVFCAINNPSNYNQCIQQYGLSPVTGNATKSLLVMNIFANNIGVLIFTLIFSLVLGAGAIFILVWNASVISVAIGVFAKNNIINLPMGLLRYLIHGIPEIAAYFVGALAGGIVSVAIIRRDLQGERMWRILQDALLLIIISVIILFLSALVEVFITPQFF